MDKPNYFMNKPMKLLLVGIAYVIFFYEAAFCEQSYDYIDITDPGFQKTPIAIPVFKAITHGPKEQKICEEASALLSDTLEFIGYFKLIDRDAFLTDPESMGVKQEDIQFKNWTVIGAEYLITGGVLISGDVQTIELRLFDTLTQTGVEGLELGYTDRLEDHSLRQIIHTYCAKVISQLFKVQGIFNSKIAFESKINGVKEIFSCDFDGYAPQQITNHDSIAMSPTWSTDRQWIAYTALVDEKWKLYIKNLVESRGSVIDQHRHIQNPVWMPNKFELAATLSDSRSLTIYSMTGGGKIIDKLTDTNRTDALRIDVSPSWSPDGKKFAFVSNRQGGRQIYVKDSDTAQVKRLTHVGEQNESPSWSPKGDKIAYAAWIDRQCNIHVIGVDGSGDIQLTYDSGDNEFPSWSPDGNLIVFSSTREGVSRIYIMTATGTDQRRLLNLPGAQSNPRWSLNLKKFDSK